MATLKVLIPFRDKFDFSKRYEQGDTICIDDSERVKDMLERKLAEKVITRRKKHSHCTDTEES